jgi:HD-GYP domain-containing protein (c-di-GMP phosphodiesterase class II)
MRLIPLDRLPNGATLAEDVRIPGDIGPPLLRRGVSMDAKYLHALRAKGVLSVWVEDQLSEGVVPARVLSPETEHRAVKAVTAALASASDGLTSGRGLALEAVHELAKVAMLIADEVHSSPELVLHLSHMMSSDQYLIQHAVDVTALGTVLASRLFREHGWVDHLGERRRTDVDPRLAKIALGLLLHDIGLLAVPRDMLFKHGPLDEDEWQHVRQHPQIGVEMLGDNVSFLIKAVVKQHHERWDGSGYPDGISGEKIHQFARIAAVADVYDAATSARVYRWPKKPHEGVAIIERGDGTEFDPEVVEVFRRVVMPYPPGEEVTLADGRSALVVAVDPRAPYAPTVRVMNGGRVEEIENAILALPVAA